MTAQDVMAEVSRIESLRGGHRPGDMLRHRSEQLELQLFRDIAKAAADGESDAWELAQIALTLKEE